MDAPPPPPPSYTPPTGPDQSESQDGIHPSLFTRLRIVLKFSRRSSTPLYTSRKQTLVSWCVFIQLISFAAIQLGQIDFSTFLAISIGYTGLMIAAHQKASSILTMAKNFSVFMQLFATFAAIFFIGCSLEHLPGSPFHRLWSVIFIGTTVAFYIQYNLIKELVASIKEEQALHDLIYTIPHLPRY